MQLDRDESQQLLKLLERCVHALEQIADLGQLLVADRLSSSTAELIAQYARPQTFAMCADCERRLAEAKSAGMAGITLCDHCLAKRSEYAPSATKESTA